MKTCFKYEDYILTQEQAQAALEKYIPAISEEEVTRLLGHIKPLLRVDGTLYQYRPKEAWDPFLTSFKWDPEGDKGERVDANKLVLLEALPTFHTCNYHMVVRPKVAEVLAQIPAHLKDKVFAFEVLFGQELTECVDYPGLYGHKTVTLLYGNA